MSACSSKDQQLSQLNDSQLEYKCKFCCKRFQYCSALGGHISKAHPGQSDAYNHKKKVRELRELERDLHTEAMQIYKDDQIQSGASPEDIALLSGQTASEKNKSLLNRNTIKRIKKDLVQKNPKYATLIPKFLGPARGSSKSVAESSPEKAELE